MSGHSKWSQIKRQKGVTDARRGQLFTKLAREITVAARQGGGDPSANYSLRLAVQRARDDNMPLDNIERALKRGTGEGAGHDAFIQLSYEGYAPGGAAVYVQVLTDNKNRALSEVRRLFTHNGGSLGESGCVAWLFDLKGVISVQVSAEKADELALSAIDAGAEDVKVEGDTLEVYTAPELLEMVRHALEADGATIASSEVQMVAKTTAPQEPRTAQQTLRLLELLEELDDVQKVYTNADFPDEVLARLAS